MKNAIRILAVAMALLTLTLTLVSCGQLSGTYVDEDGDLTYTFKGQKVTVSDGETSIEADYKVKGDTIEFELNDTKISLSFDRDGFDLIIDGERYERTKRTAKKDSATLSGTYVTEQDGVEVAIEFSSKNFTMRMSGIEIEGTYTIKDDEITMSYDIMGEVVTETASFEKNKKGILIDDVEFIKK